MNLQSDILDPAGEDAGGGALRQSTVLIADGDNNARRELGAQLSGLGHTVVGETDSGLKAIALARNIHPDLVILDITLTDLSGFDVSESLSREGIAPTLLISDAVSEESIDRFERSGAMGYLTKPSRISELGPNIQIALARWQRLRELEAEIASLNERMEARKLVGRAKAILMERFNLQERDAFRRIQAQSSALNKPVHEIARAIITAHDVSA